MTTLSVRAPLAALLLVGVGCMSVRPVTQPAQFIPQTNPDVVLVIYNDNSEVPVENPRMSGDTLIGTWAGLGEPVAAPLSQVQRIDARQRDRTKTRMLIGGIAALTVAMGYVTLEVARGGSGPACDYSGQTGQVPAGCTPCSLKSGQVC